MESDMAQGICARGSNMICRSIKKKGKKDAEDSVYVKDRKKVAMQGSNTLTKDRVHENGKKRPKCDVNAIFLLLLEYGRKIG